MTACQAPICTADHFTIAPREWKAKLALWRQQASACCHSTISLHQMNSLSNEWQLPTLLSQTQYIVKHSIHLFYEKIKGHLTTVSNTCRYFSIINFLKTFLSHTCCKCHHPIAIRIMKCNQILSYFRVKIKTTTQKNENNSY